MKDGLTRDYRAIEPAEIWQVARVSIPAARPHPRRMFEEVTAEEDEA